MDLKFEFFQVCPSLLAQFLTIESEYAITFLLSSFQSATPPFPYIKSTHSLVAKHVTPEKWAKLGGLKTKTSGFTLSQVRQTIILSSIADIQHINKMSIVLIHVLYHPQCLIISPHPLPYLLYHEHKHNSQ